ncbi:MAG: zf-HC2 domain-containing protein [Actinomycetota bacterium]|nr:zf-HC2 domain-containing protein [Actinomycetota bacterium]
MKTRRNWVTCWWTARQLQRYLDADPNAMLGQERITLIERHLATCAQCATLTAEYQQLLALLHELGATRTPDERLVRQLQEHLSVVLEQERP